MNAALDRNVKPQQNPSPKQPRQSPVAVQEWVNSNELANENRRNKRKSLHPLSRIEDRPFDFERYEGSAQLFNVPFDHSRNLIERATSNPSHLDILHKTWPVQVTLAVVSGVVIYRNNLAEENRMPETRIRLC
jgi:hypothetical protein